MKTSRLLLFLVFILLGSLADAFAERPAVKIGVLVPLSGDMALHGREIQNALELAQKKHANTYYDYRFVFEDSRLEPARTASAAKRLIHQEKVDVIITLWPPTANIVIPMSGYPYVREKRHPPLYHLLGP